jgi:hypothetical protein
MGVGVPVMCRDLSGENEVLHDEKADNGINQFGCAAHVRKPRVEHDRVVCV